jgi:cytoskeletal protein RodZ
MERIGERLRRRREELGFTIDDIARATKYRPEVIKDVEDGRAGVFPAEAYRQAFLRAYSEKLDLDPAEILREQKSEEERVKEALKGIRLKPRKVNGSRRTLVWLIIVIAVAAGILIVYDRVIRVRGVEEPIGAESGPPAAVTDSTDTPADSQAVVAPMDSVAGSEVVAPTGGERDKPSDTGSEETAPSRDEAEGNRGAAAEPSGKDEDSRLADVESRRDDALSNQLEGAAGSRVTSYAEEEAEALVPAVAPSPRLDAGRTDGDWLVASVRRYAVKARLRAGDSILVNRWLSPGFSDTFYSSQPFWADTLIVNENSLSLVFNGEKVDLSGASGGVITNLKISP